MDEFSRERAAYRYRNEKLEVIHYTSVPKSDDEAIKYCETLIALDFPEPRYIEYRDFSAAEYTPLCVVEYIDNATS